MDDDTDPDLPIPLPPGPPDDWLVSLADCRHFRVVEPSRRVGTYKVIEVYHQREMDLWTGDREVTGPSALFRFGSNLQCIARLRHPALPEIHDGGDHLGRPYLLGVGFSSPTLREWVEGSPTSPAKAVEITIRLARGAHRLHEAGIVRLDLMMNSVRISRPFEPMIDTTRLLVRSLEEEDLDRIHGGLTGCEAPELLMDSPFPMGPESDVYALGAILYWMLTGRAAVIRGESGYRAMRNILEAEPVPIRSINDDVDRTLEMICLKCLEKNPKRRPGSATILADDLERWRSPEPPGPIRDRRRWPGWWPGARRRPQSSE